MRRGSLRVPTHSALGAGGGVNLRPWTCGAGTYLEVQVDAAVILDAGETTVSSPAVVGRARGKDVRITGEDLGRKVLDSVGEPVDLHGGV